MSLLNFLVKNAKDMSPPKISGVDVPTNGQTSFVVTWTTDEPGTSQVQYKITGGAYSYTTLDTNLVNLHSVTVTGLTAYTIYRFNAISKDQFDNTATSAEYINRTTH